MLTTLRPEILSVSVNEGSVLIDAPGLAVTLDIETASFLSDELLAASASARRQQHALIDQCAHVGQS
jgi:hypothetical protein